MFLSKEASNKDVDLKTQMMIAMKDDKTESSTERVSRENSFFKDHRTDLMFVKGNFSKNTLVHVNNGPISPVKGRQAMYLDYVIQVQIMPISNLPPDLDLETDKFWHNEVLIYTPLYSSQNGLYRGLRKKLGYVTLRGDANEMFYSYGLDKERSKTLFCVNKQPLLNIF